MLLLGGCSYFDIGDEEAGAGPAVDLTASQPRQSANEIDVIGLVNQSSDPSVEVFNLDGTPAPGKYTAENAARASSRGAVSSSDPSVEVFPLDDAMRGVTPPSLLPSGERYTPGGGATPVAPVESAPAGGPEARIFFDHDSDEVDGEGDAAIARLVNRFAGGGGLSVEGHASVKANFADEVQRKIVNLRVSMNRALSVARELIAGGVPADSIRTVAWGDTKPPLAVEGKDAEAAARRVEVYAQTAR